MHSSLFLDISLIIALAAGVALIMKALRQPLIIGHIITGIIAGPALLNIIHVDTAFTGLSAMGVALLLFIIGLDLSVRVFARLGKTIVWTTVLQVGVITVLGTAASYALGFGRVESAVMGLGLALSSTIIIVKLFNDKKETTRLYAQITIGVLLLQDVIATAAKIGLAAKAHDDGSTIAIILLLARGLGITLLLYLASRYLVPRLTKPLESNKELLLVFALGWGLGFAALFERVGFSIEIGALFAGVSLASLPYSSEMASRLKPLRDFFLIIFFITLGQALTPGKLAGAFGVAVVLSLLVLLLKPLVAMVSLGSLGYTKRASFKSAISLSQVSEFSLVLLASALSVGLVREQAATTITLVALITFVVSTYLIKYDTWLYTRLERHLRLFERRVTRFEQKDGSHHYPIVLFGYQKGGHEFLKTFRSMKQKFVVVDYDPEVIDSLERQDVHFLYGDATDPELLEEMDLAKARLVVSTMSDFETNRSLGTWLNTHNPRAVFVCSADTIEQASDLYADGAAYVMMPHYIGSEKISSFIKRNGFNKTEFKAFREKHLAYLQTHHSTVLKSEAA